MENLRQALRLLQQKGASLRRCSSVYRTEPWGIEEQDVFLNLVCEVAWSGSPEALLDLALQTENQMGRVRQVKWGPRLIDVDLIDVHRRPMAAPRLTLPHPYYRERDFVLVPLAELEPEWHSAEGQPIQSLIEALGDTGITVAAPPFTPESLTPQN
mgnify:CR=1 FL=1